MREHSHESDETSLRPKSARVDDAPGDHVGRAAASGRPDVLSGHDVLGLQRVAGNAGVSSLVDSERSPVLDVVSGGGRALDPEVRTDMEGRLGHDFSDVRVHDDGAAHASAQAVHAHAYTVGPNIVFQRDAFDPSSASGRTTLAHELTHVVQQRSGPVDGTSTGGGIRVSDPSDRFEREASATAERAMASPADAPTPVAATDPAPAVQREEATGVPAVQREEAEEAEEEKSEEPVQGLFVQREEAEDEAAEEG